MKKIILFGALFTIISLNVFAQRGYNPNSVYPVLEDDIMWRKTVWRLINLEEKQNKPFLAKKDQDNLLAAILMDALWNGKIQAYAVEMDVEDRAFIQDLKLEDDSRFANLEVDNEDPGSVPSDPTRDKENMIFAKDVTLIQLREDCIFDKRRSRMYFDTQAVTLILPNGAAAGAANRYIAQMKFKDVHAYLKNLFEESNEAIGYWYNDANNRRKMCYADAFDLRLFSSRIIKISNHDGDYLNTIVNSDIQAELERSQEIEYELMEFEHNLWEF